MQRLGTIVSTFALQTLGLPAVSEGNVILIDDLHIGVLEACNGLGMLSAFFAISTTVALVIRRPLADRVGVFLSAIPIGVLMNLIRADGDRTGLRGDRRSGGPIVLSRSGRLADDAAGVGRRGTRTIPARPACFRFDCCSPQRSPIAVSIAEERKSIMASSLRPPR